jgi:hypothetical protein
VLLAVLYSLLVAVGRPCRCLRRPPSLSSHFSSHQSRPPCGAGTTSVYLSVPDSDNLSQFLLIDFACSINLTAFRGDFTAFALPSAPSRVGGVGVDVKGSGSVRISVRLASAQLTHRTIHALYTPDLSSRSAQRIGRLLSVSWMQSHSGCEFLFPTDSDTGLMVVPTRVGVLEPSCNGLYLLPHNPELPPSPSQDTARSHGPRVALNAQCDPVMWHRRFGHLNMKILHA